MKEKKNQKIIIQDGFWNIPRPTITMEEALKDVIPIDWEKALKGKKASKKDIIIFSSKEKIQN